MFAPDCRLTLRVTRGPRGAPVAAVRNRRARETVGFTRLSGGEAECKITRMTKATEAVLADALRLDADARAELAAEILASLDGPADPDAEAEWAVEIQRRVAAIASGTAQLEPWEEVKRRIEKEILGR